MSIESSVNSDEMVNRARNWDYPNGLGWQLWRRAQSTSLLTQPIQRALARLRTSILRDPAPLASDIRRRWGVGGDSSLDRFGLDLPLFSGRFPFFRGITAQHLSESGPGTAHRSADISRSSSAYETSQSSRPTTSASAPNIEVDARETAQAMAPQSAAGSGDTIVPSLARRAVPAAVSLNQERSGRNGSRFALTTLPTRRSPLPPRFMTTLQRFPLVPGTGVLSSAILERYDSIPALVPRSRAKFRETENGPVLALMQPSYEASAQLKTTARSQFGSTANRSPSVPDALARDAAARQRELRASAQDSRVLTVQSMDYAPSSVSHRDLQPAIPVAGQRERTISRSASSKPGGVNSMSEGTALTTDRVKGNSAPQRHGLGDVTTLQPGGLMTGVILRALGTRSPVGVRPPPSTVTRQQSEQIPVLDNRSFASTFSARGFITTLNRSTYGPAQGLDSAAGAKEIVRIGASPNVAERSVDRNTSSGELPRTERINAPVAKILTNATEDEIVQTSGLPQTTPATFQRTAAITQPLTARANREPRLPTQSNEGGIIRFGDGYNTPGFTARKMAIGLHATAMPLSIGPIFQRDPSIPGTAQQRIFPKTSVGFPLTVLRAEDHGPTRFDNFIRGAETGEGIRVFSGGRAGIQENQTGLDSRLRGNDEFGFPTRSTNSSTTALVSGRSVSRAGIETRHISGDATTTSAGTLPAQPHIGELPATDVHDPLSMEVRISRAAVTGAGFGTVRDYGDAANLQGWLPINRGSLLLRGFPRPQSSVQRVVGGFAAPLFIATSAIAHTAGSEQLSDISSVSRANQSVATFSAGWIRATAAGESSEFHRRSASLMPAVIPMRPITMTAPTLLHRLHALANQEQHASAPATREPLQDMPFAALTGTSREGSLTVAHRTNGSSLQMAMQEPASAATRAVPNGGGGEPRVAETPAVGAQLQFDLDEVVEKAWQKLMRKLTIEQERRGYSRWS